jgi:hypothetical protein
MIDAAQEIAALRAQLAEREAELAVARSELTGAKLLIEQMTAQLAKLRRMQFGRSSEKLDTQIQQLELMLEDLEEGEATRLAQLRAPGLISPNDNHRVDGSSDATSPASTSIRTNYDGEVVEKDYVCRRLEPSCTGDIELYRPYTAIGFPKAPGSGLTPSPGPGGTIIWPSTISTGFLLS